VAEHRYESATGRVIKKAPKIYGVRSILSVKLRGSTINDATVVQQANDCDQFP
jgi:hypothetical protein